MSCSLEVMVDAVRAGCINDVTEVRHIVDDFVNTRLEDLIINDLTKKIMGIFGDMVDGYDRELSVDEVKRLTVLDLIILIESVGTSRYRECAYYEGLTEERAKMFYTDIFVMLLRETCKVCIPVMRLAAVSPIQYKKFINDSRYSYPVIKKDEKCIIDVINNYYKVRNSNWNFIYPINTYNHNIRTEVFKLRKLFIFGIVEKYCEKRTLYDVLSDIRGRYETENEKKHSENIAAHDNSVYEV